jgi:adenylate cyclase
MLADGPAARSTLRLASGLVMLAFVICHLVAHSFLLVSLDRAESILEVLMRPWRSGIGTTLLASASLIHYANALWSIYARRSLRLPAWEWWQLALGLCIPALLIHHVVCTRVAESLLQVNSGYQSILVIQWVIWPWLAVVQAAAVLTVWGHASIGIHFWLRTKSWYPAWRRFFVIFAVLLPTLALAGFVAGGNQVLRATQIPLFAEGVLDAAHFTGQARVEIGRIAEMGWSIHLGLVLAAFAGRGLHHFAHRLRSAPKLVHSSGRTVSIVPGATVLEMLRANRIAHASVCGGRARCTTCRIRVTRGLAGLPAPAALEAKALARIHAPEGLRLACQIRPTVDISILPLLTPDAGAVDGTVRGGLEGTERLITVVFVDLRGFTTLAEAKLPYDVLFILNRFFHEMTGALTASNGHFSQFTGDGLMALYGLDAEDPARGAADALRGARDMLARLEQLNRQLRAELPQPLRIGIGIHFSEAIVGAMGPPRSQIITAIGDTVNTAARLEGLTKEFDCALILSRPAAEAAGMNLGDRKLHEAAVKGRVQTVQFYALETVPEPPA